MWILVLTLTLSASLAGVSYSGLTGGALTQKTMMFLAGAFICAIFVSLASNIYCWCKFGILRHNEFYNIRDGVLKRFAFTKAGLLAAILIACICNLVLGQ